MNVLVNGERHKLEAPITIARLLEVLAMDQPKGIAVAKNLSVVPRSRWASELVAEGDEIEIVRATQGG